MKLNLTVGYDSTGRRLAVISRGGHPKLRPDQECELLTVEVVSGWTEPQIMDWFHEQEKDAPWETRQ